MTTKATKPECLVMGGVTEALVCECCAATHDADDYTAAIAGWRKTHDGWVCPCAAPTPSPAADGFTAADMMDARKEERERMTDAQGVGGVDVMEALRRAEMKLAAYVGVCKGDKELTEAVLPMVRAALSAQPRPETDDSAAWLAALTLPDGYDVHEHLPGIWEHRYTGTDGEQMVSGTSWNHPALAAIAAWEAVTQQPRPEGAPVGVEVMHPETADLVRRFAQAVAEKLAEAERKYGWDTHWKSPAWMDQCREQLVAHVAKGDPRDVAAYAAFLWHHGEQTALAQQPAATLPDEDDSDLTVAYMAGRHDGRKESRQPAGVDEAKAYPLWQAIHAAAVKAGHPCNVGLAQVVNALDALAQPQGASHE